MSSLLCGTPTFGSVVFPSRQCAGHSPDTRRLPSISDDRPLTWREKRPLFRSLTPPPPFSPHGRRPWRGPAPHPRPSSSSVGFHGPPLRLSPALRSATRVIPSEPPLRAVCRGGALVFPNLILRVPQRTLRCDSAPSPGPVGDRAVPASREPSRTASRPHHAATSLDESNPNLGKLGNLGRAEARVLDPAIGPGRIRAEYGTNPRRAAGGEGAVEMYSSF